MKGYFDQEVIHGKILTIPCITGVTSSVTSEKIQTWEILNNFSIGLKNLKIDLQHIILNWC